MKVLILHQHFRTPYEGGAIRSYYLGQALAQHGFEVTVITGYNGPNDKVEVVDRLTVYYLAVPYKNSFGFLKRGLSFIQFIRKSMKAAFKLKAPDFCYAISVPLTVGIAGSAIASKFHIPFLFEVGDLWPDAPIQMGYIKNNWFKTYLYNLEQGIYHKAKVVVALSNPIAEAVKQKSPGADVRIIPNMSDTEFFRPEEKDPQLEAKYGVSGKFVVSYTGAIGVANGLEHFIQCAEEAQAGGLNMHFILCGEGAQLPTLKSLAAKIKLSNFSFVPLVSRDRVREIFNITDASFISYAPYKILETGSPNKYFDALAAGKLIIVNFDGWIRAEVEKNKCGIFVDPHKNGQFVKLITPFLLQSPLSEYQQASRRLAENAYSRNILGREFAAIFQNIG